MAEIPLILTGTRPAPDTWYKKDTLPGPPLSRSPADILTEAGVLFAIALVNLGGTFIIISSFIYQYINMHILRNADQSVPDPAGDPRIQSLALEASWVAKYAGLSDSEALALVSTKVEDILGLQKSKDIVVWEGDPLHFGTPVLAFQSQEGKLEVSSCWPNGMDE